jgi:NADH-quinone oxidoreductase subunit A
LIYTAADPSSAWPLLVYAVVVLFLMAAIIAASYVLGQRHKERETAVPYESGVPTTGTARLRFSIRFYLVAMFFVIFDLESAFLFAWAIAFRWLGWGGYIAALVFALTLLLMVFYLARTGGLDFIAKPKKILAPPGMPAVPEERR